MKVTAWYEDIKLKNPDIRGEISNLPEGIEIKLKKIHSVGNVSCKIEGFIPGKYVLVNLNVETEGNVKSETYVTWYKNGEEIFVEYVCNKDKIIPYKDADEMKLSVMAYGRDSGFAKISDVEVSVGEEVKERKAVVAALSIPYGYIWEHRLRTCDDNVRDSLNRIDGLVKEYENKIDLIVLTETFNSRITSVEYDKTFITLESEHIKMMKAKAKEHGVYLAFSFRERTGEGGISNSALLIDRNGEVISYYRKTHLTHGEKLAGLTPGEEFVVCDTDFGRVGFAICWDLYYPETARALVKKGAELIINPTAGYSVQMHTQRAMDAGAYVVAGAVWGRECSVISPGGEIMADGAITGAAVAEVDFNTRYPVKYLAVSSYAERRNVYYRELRDDLYKKG